MEVSSLLLTLGENDLGQFTVAQSIFDEIDLDDSLRELGNETQVLLVSSSIEVVNCLIVRQKNRDFTHF